MDKLAEQIIADILVTQLDLDESQVWLRYQNEKIPPDDRLYIVVGMSDSQIISSVNTPTPTYDGMSETLQVVARENIQIDIFSRSLAALQRRWEALASLNSVYSQQQQELYQFRIFPLPTSFVNTSSAEGGSNINRFSIIIACHTWYRQEKVLQSPNDYYNDFDTRVDDEETISEPEGLIEFNIHEE